MGRKGEQFVLPVQLFCKPKIVLKKSLLSKKKNCFEKNNI